MRVDPMNVSKVETSVVFSHGGVVWDTLMEKWAGEGEDWAQEVTMHPAQEGGVIVALLKMTRQPAKHPLKIPEGALGKNHGNWILGLLKEGSWRTIGRCTLFINIM